MTRSHGSSIGRPRRVVRPCEQSGLWTTVNRAACVSRAAPGSAGTGTTASPVLPAYCTTELSAIPITLGCTISMSEKDVSPNLRPPVCTCTISQWLKCKCVAGEAQVETPWTEREGGGEGASPSHPSDYGVVRSQRGPGQSPDRKKSLVHLFATETIWWKENSICLWYSDTNKPPVVRISWKPQIKVHNSVILILSRVL